MGDKKTYFICPFCEKKHFWVKPQKTKLYPYSQKRCQGKTQLHLGLDDNE